MLLRNLINRFVLFNMKLTKIFDSYFPRFIERQNYKDVAFSIVKDFINRNNGCSVLEVGCIDRPLLKRSSNFIYDGLDIEYKEQCDEIYDNFYVQTIEQPIGKTYNLIMSMALLEHVRDNQASIRQIYNALKPRGLSIHYFPSKYHPYSIILRLVDPKWQNILIKLFHPWAVNVTGYPVFFDKCSPKEMQILCRQCGFERIKITPFFRANDYFRFFFPCYVFVTFWENICKKLKMKQLCSGLVIVMEKPKNITAELEAKSC